MWLAVPLPIRQKIAADFNLTRSGETEVFDNKVMCDGYTDNDLMKITEEGLDERLLKTQKTLPQEFMKKWEYYVADMGEEPVQYSTDEALDEGIKKGLNDREIEQAKEIAEEVIAEKEHRIVSKKVLQEIAKSKEPKKMGRPKGSKSKVVKKKR